MAFESNIICTKCVHLRGANKFKKFNHTTRDYVVSTVVLSITVPLLRKTPNFVARWTLGTFYLPNRSNDNVLFIIIKVQEYIYKKRH